MLNTNSLPEPEITAWWAGIDPEPFAPGDKSSDLSADSYNLEYCYTGRGRLTINGITHQIETGDCFFTFPDCPTTFEADAHDPWAKSWVCFSGTGVASYLTGMGITPERPVFPWRGRTELLECVDSIRAAVNDTSSSLRVTRFNQNLCANRVFALLAAACDESQNHKPPMSPQEKYVDMAMRYIDNSVKSRAQDLTVNRVAAHVGLDRAYFSTLFQRTVGKSPREYIIDARIRQACVLFTNPLSTASNVASALGYEPAPFCRIFKKVMGMTPMEYKQSLSHGVAK